MGECASPIYTYKWAKCIEHGFMPQFKCHLDLYLPLRLHKLSLWWPHVRMAQPKKRDYTALESDQLSWLLITGDSDFFGLIIRVDLNRSLRGFTWKSSYAHTPCELIFWFGIYDVTPLSWVHINFFRALYKDVIWCHPFRFVFLFLYIFYQITNLYTKMGLLDIVPAGVITGDNVKKLFDYGAYLQCKCRWVPII